MLSMMSVFAYAKGERYGATASTRHIYDSDKQDNNIPQFGILHTRPMDENNNRWRWWFEVNYLQETINSSKQPLYQELNGIEVRVVPQYAIASLGPFTPYIGAGISVGYQMYSNRWNLDEQGYKYGDQLNDIAQFEMGGVISLGTAIKIGGDPNSHLQIIAQISYLIPMNDGLSGAELSLSFLF